MTENQKQGAEICKEIQKSKKTSAKLKDLCRQEEKLYLDEALELAEYSVKVFDKSDEKSVTVEEYSSDKSSRNIVFDAHESPTEEEWDPLGVALTPRKEVLPPDSSALEEPISATWSTKVNQFFPLSCESTPIPLLRRKESTETNLPSPRVCLHDILEGNEDEDSEDFFDNLAPLVAVDEQVDDTELPPPITDMMMEEEEYKTRLAAAHKDVVKVRVSIDEFTADAVNIGDKDTYNADLDGIRNEFRLARDKIYDLITDLDPD